ncbi:hypothetical protein [Leptotrichia sp. oral taxon 212]|uniref:hypothetical protein n=1 Tax=Leptotrichia sp. oral taxon 212 TaxID=712357 RepID=UPI0006A986A6|nr:hypothetical protein [Leptotrichia sp. oral taxon 212]ALA94658.1 hypothetical protein AMK43_00075 [Leptotrichia sp. oral taxon 212]
MKKSKILLTALLVSCSLNSLSANLSASKKKSKPVQTSVSTEKKDIFANISRSELNAIGEKIFKNEAAGKKENLVYWNEGENFPSLGIGHFIWYKQGEPGIFEESFPQLVEFLKSKNVKLPKIMAENKYSPWKDRQELINLKTKKIPDTDIEELTNFLYENKDLQIMFIFKRLESSLEKMLAVSNDRENVRKQFYRVASSPNGLYPLIDYVNFKGEGTNPKERYNGQGWGLLQVLENMKGTETGKSALTEFSNSAKFVLQRRVNNSDPSKKERKWLQGWFNRCNTYAE